MEAARHIQQVGGIGSFAEFVFVDQAIRIGATMFPAVKMRWVDGVGLDRYVIEKSRTPAGRVHLFALVRKLAELADELERNRIAHGDIQPSNIIVTPEGELRLIDYDAVCVPATVGEPLAESGHDDYVHPRWSRSVGDLLQDRFPFWALILGTIALAHDPDSNFLPTPSGDIVLFSSRDHAADSDLRMRMREAIGPLSTVEDAWDDVLNKAYDLVPPVGPFRSLATMLIPQQQQIEQVVSPAVRAPADSPDLSPAPLPRRRTLLISSVTGLLLGATLSPIALSALGIATFVGDTPLQLMDGGHDDASISHSASTGSLDIDAADSIDTDAAARPDASLNLKDDWDGPRKSAKGDLQGYQGWTEADAACRADNKRLPTVDQFMKHAKNKQWADNLPKGCYLTDDSYPVLVSPGGVYPNRTGSSDCPVNFFLAICVRKYVR